MDSWRASPRRFVTAIPTHSRTRPSASPARAVHLGAQLLALRQWARIRAHAARRGVLVVGDLPLFVSPDAVDAWVDRELFCWGPDLNPDPETGAPPDTSTSAASVGRRPTTTGRSTRRRDSGRWRERLDASLVHADVVRVDHFRGLAAAWAIPRAAHGDARLGSWRPSPVRRSSRRCAPSMPSCP